MKRMIVGIFAVLTAVCAAPVFAQASGAGEVQEKNIPLKVAEVAPGLYFQYHHEESNNAWLVTDDGVLVVDTRQHPRRAEELLAAIRKTTDKPIRWVVNTHAHGDHYFGNSVFKREGATIIAHRDTAGMMAKPLRAGDEAPSGLLQATEVRSGRGKAGVAGCDF